MNKTLKRMARAGLIAAALFTASAPAPVLAAGAAPAMYGVKEVLLQYPHLNNPEAASFCGLAHLDLLAGMVKDLKSYNIPVFPPLEAMPPQIGTARIELWPEIYTLNNEGIDCTSWISLSAHTDNNVNVPPINLPRSVTINYWEKGILVTSSESQHMRIVTAALIRLGEDFATRFIADQPGIAVPPIEKK